MLYRAILEAVETDDSDTSAGVHPPTGGLGGLRAPSDGGEESL